MSLGIPRSFPRLCPPAGLVTVALLTLAPLALRPVRLACLIHAANVHSEPGSNPSKSVVSLGSPRGRASRHAPLPTGRGYLTGRTATGCRPGQAPALPPRDAWLVLPSPPRTRPNRDGRGPDASAPRRLPSRVHSTNSATGTTCDRPNCQRTDLIATLTAPAGVTFPKLGCHAGRQHRIGCFSRRLALVVHHRACRPVLLRRHCYWRQGK